MRWLRWLVAVVVILGAVTMVGLDIAARQAEGRLNVVLPSQGPPVGAAAEALHARLFVADLHADPLLWHRDLNERATRGQSDVPRLLEGNVGLQVFGVVTRTPKGQNVDRNDASTDAIRLLTFAQRWPPATWFGLRARALHQAAKLERTAERSDGRLVVIRRREDLETLLERRSSDPQVLGGLLALEGLHAIEGELANVDVLYEAGFRMLAPAHFFDNEVSGSAHGVEKGGLTPLGREVIRRMNERRMIVDLAHASARTIDDVLALTRRPVVVSHTGVRGTCDNNRNLTDDQLRRIAATGGVIGIGFWNGAVCGHDAKAIARAISHAVKIAGMDHVGLGSDFDGAVTTPFDASGLARITEALLGEGFTEEQVAKVMGGNVIRVLKAALP